MTRRARHSPDGVVDGAEPPSKSALKREHAALQDLARRALDAPPGRVDRLALEEPIAHAIREGRRIPASSARARHIRYLGKLLAADPANARYQVGLAMANIGRQDFTAARAILDPLIEKRPSGPAYFARALAGYFSGDAAAARRDLDMALRAEPNNPQYRALRERLDAGPAAPPRK